MNRVFLLIILCGMIMSCSKKATTQSSNVVSDDYTCESNESGEYMVCSKEIKEEKSISTYISYYIASKSGEQLTSGTLSSGRVAWVGENAVEVYQTPGNISEDMDENEIIRVYLVDEQKFISKKEYLEK